ncbi:lipopolysaccharide transport periplasmic protein LptA [Hydrogenimonas cancrithermarum]|uniref:Organic solvent tolerance-like N-terminal domain-containing protein n=1 Tax=Hydrogenimonas cancrithermarum TaxID=2993563 RepID=A0ABN6WXJ6_9BACT|nr:lipopolysaccharide transport periplasmic protein LptA [Hydrogenimonas cancrithermarum]BDY13917.1 hypothetical protein HCR_22290 [Hydrogenimonas cancrithermarum]
MKKLWSLTLFCLSAVAIYAASEQVEITADRFEASETERLTKFIGHVHMKKGPDELNASKVFVYFDKARKPMRYEAVGNTSFVIHMDNNQTYVGRADRLLYRPGKEIYELFGNVVLKEPRLDRTLMGEKVVVEKISGKAHVEGKEDKPVKFIFKVEDKNASKDR